MPQNTFSPLHQPPECGLNSFKASFQQASEQVPVDFLAFPRRALDRQHLPVALLVDADHHQQGQVANALTPAHFEVARVHQQVRVVRFQRAFAPALDLVHEASCDPTDGVLADLHVRQGFRDAADPSRANSLQIHFQDGVFDVPGHAFVAFEHLSDELALTIPGHVELLDLPDWGDEIAPVVPVSFASTCGGPLAMLSLEVFSHFFFEDLFEDGFHAGPDALVDVTLNVGFGVVSWCHLLSLDLTHNIRDVTPVPVGDGMRRPAG